MARLALFASFAVLSFALGCPPPDEQQILLAEDEACAGGGVRVGSPLPPGTYTVGQGNGGAFSHTGFNEFGFDFTVAKGTDVIAARAGTVVVVVDEFGDGGGDVSFAAEANFVVVDHGAGTFDSYFHLEQGGMAVAVGDTVRSGDPIGRSGNSGFTSGPHLHFAVVDAKMQSLPSCFAPDDLVPATDDTVDLVANGFGDATVFPRSFFGADDFAGDGVVIDNDVTAFTIDGSVHVEGHVTDGNHRAAVLLAPFTGGNALAQVIVDVDDGGGFVADLDCSGFAGLQGFGVSSVDDATGSFGVDVLAPVTVR